MSQARNLDALLNGTRSVSQNALKAANAYKDIDNTIQQAREVAEAARADADNATLQVGDLGPNEETRLPESEWELRLGYVINRHFRAQTTNEMLESRLPLSL